MGFFQVKIRWSEGTLASILDGDEPIYLPQPNREFEPTLYMQRIAAVLGLEYQSLREKISRGEIKDKIATGGFGWRDENRGAVF